MRITANDKSKFDKAYRFTLEGCTADKASPTNPLSDLRCRARWTQIL